jgi:hypothetical protein
MLNTDKVDISPAWLDTQFVAFFNEPAIAGKTTSVLPSTMSSAIIPLLASSR